METPIMNNLQKHLQDQQIGRAARVALVAVLLLILAGCGTPQVVTFTHTPSRTAFVAATARPSVTPLGTPLGGFGAQTAPTLTPVGAIAATPIPPTGAPVVLNVTATPVPSPTRAIDLPSGNNDGFVAGLLRNFIIPLWNFVLDLSIGTISNLWVFTGDRYGIIAQLACCVVPLLLSALGMWRAWIMRRGGRGGGGGGRRQRGGGNDNDDDGA
jgi:hypothetical protein